MTVFSELQISERHYYWTLLGTCEFFVQGIVDEMMQFNPYYNSTQNTSLIRELDLSLVLWKQTALSRALWCFNSRQRSLLRRLYQGIFIQARVVQGIRHRVYFMFSIEWSHFGRGFELSNRVLIRGVFFFSLFFYICIYCICLTITTIFKNNKYKTTITYLTVNVNKISYISDLRIFTTCAFIKWRLRLSDAISQVMYCVWLQNAFVNSCILLTLYSSIKPVNHVKHIEQIKQLSCSLNFVQFTLIQRQKPNTGPFIQSANATATANAVFRPGIV